jgi:hypothetical protein
MWPRLVSNQAQYSMCASGSRLRAEVDPFLGGGIENVHKLSMRALQHKLIASDIQDADCPGEHVIDILLQGRAPENVGRTLRILRSRRYQLRTCIKCAQNKQNSTEKLDGVNSLCTTALWQSRSIVHHGKSPLHTTGWWWR